MTDGARKESRNETDRRRRSVLFLSTYAIILLDILALSTAPARSDGWGTSAIDRSRRIAYVCRVVKKFFGGLKKLGAPKDGARMAVAVGKS
jgi:hypothetical protein